MFKGIKIRARNEAVIKALGTIDLQINDARNELKIRRQNDPESFRYRDSHGRKGLKELCEMTPQEVEILGFDRVIGYLEVAKRQIENQSSEATRAYKIPAE